MTEDSNIEEEEEDLIQQIINDLEGEGEKEEDQGPLYEFNLKDVEFQSIEDGPEEHTQPEYATDLGPREAVAGDFHHVEFVLKNETDLKFPGGKLDGLRVGRGIGADMTYPDTEQSIPSLEPDEGHKVTFHINITKYADQSLKADFTSSDNGTTKTNGNEDEVAFAFRAIERETLQMVTHLKDIKELLEDD